MTVYVDDARIPASVRNGSRTHTSTWCHLTADTQEELHAFAAQLGLKRSYFQPGKPIGGKPSPFWHYDVTAGKRVQAVALGAVEVPARELPVICRSRATRSASAAAAPPAERKQGEASPAGEELSLLPGTGPVPPLLVTASRDGLTRADVQGALQPHFVPGRVLISGGARGGDLMSEEVWEGWGGTVERRAVDPAAWQRSRGAGYQRDAEMVTEARARGGECVAIIARCARAECTGTARHGSHGTVNTARMAEAAGMRVDRVKAGGHAQSCAAAEPEARRHGRYYPPEMELPQGICPGCRSATLTSGRVTCQGCDMAAGYRPAAATYADLSHGQPGHLCVLPARPGGPEAVA
jgi:hypothetical protein